jgi:hypothetical protein
MPYLLPKLAKDFALTPKEFLSIIISSPNFNIFKRERHIYQECKPVEEYLMTKKWNDQQKKEYSQYLAEFENSKRIIEQRENASTEEISSHFLKVSEISKDLRQYFIQSLNLEQLRNVLTSLQTLPPATNLEEPIEALARMVNPNALLHVG